MKNDVVGANDMEIVADEEIMKAAKEKEAGKSRFSEKSNNTELQRRGLWDRLKLENLPVEYRGDEVAGSFAV